MEPSVSRAFRRDLARELPDWHSAGLVDDTTEVTLRSRYRLDDLKDAERNDLVRVLVLLGGLAVGAGIVTFVASQWSGLGMLGRVGIAGILTVAAHALWLALRERAGSAAYAHAAAVVAALGTGATLALGAQATNAPLALWQLYALWTVAILPLAIAAKEPAIGVVALGTAGAAFVLHASDGHVHIAEYLAWSVALGLLAWRLELRWFADLTGAVIGAAAGLLVTLAMSIPPQPVHGRPAFELAALASILGVMLATRSRRWHAVAAIAGLALAFRTTFWAGANDHAGTIIYPHNLDTIVIAVALVVAIALRRPWQQPWTFASVVAIAAAHLLSLTGLPALEQVVVANVLFLVPVAALLRRGVLERDRIPFLGGVLLLSILGLARFVEYDHDLTTKALAFALTGIALITIGALFDRYTRGDLARA